MHNHCDSTLLSVTCGGNEHRNFSKPFLPGPPSSPFTCLQADIHRSFRAAILHCSEQMLLWTALRMSTSASQLEMSYIYLFLPRVRHDETLYGLPG